MLVSSGLSWKDSAAYGMCGSRNISSDLGELSRFGVARA